MGKNAHKLKNYLCIFFPLIYFSQFSINIDVSHILLVQLLKVRQSHNGSFQLTIPRKKQRTDSFFCLTVLCQILLFIFWKNSRIPESPFEINWPLIWDTFMSIENWPLEIMGLFVLSCSRDPATNSKTTNLELKYKLAG